LVVDSCAVAVVADDVPFIAAFVATALATLSFLHPSHLYVSTHGEFVEMGFLIIISNNQSIIALPLFSITLWAPVSLVDSPFHI
jgi:hypothetical protein